MKKLIGIIAGLIGVGVAGWYIWRRWGNGYATEHAERDEVRKSERHITKAA